MEKGVLKLCILKTFAFIHNNTLPYQQPDIEQATMSPSYKARSGSELTLEVLAQNLLLVSATSCWARTEEEGGGLCCVLGTVGPLSPPVSRAPVARWTSRGADVARVPRSSFRALKESELSSSLQALVFEFSISLQRRPQEFLMTASLELSFKSCFVPPPGY